MARLVAPDERGSATGEDAQGAQPDEAGENRALVPLHTDIMRPPGSGVQKVSPILGLRPSSPLGRGDLLPRTGAVRVLRTSSGRYLPPTDQTEAQDVLRRRSNGRH